MKTESAFILVFITIAIISFAGLTNVRHDQMQDSRIKALEDIIDSRN